MISIQPFSVVLAKSTAVHQYVQSREMLNKVRELKTERHVFHVYVLNTRPFACSPVASASSTSTKTGASGYSRTSLNHKEIPAQIYMHTYIIIYYQFKVKGSLVFSVFVTILYYSDLIQISYKKNSFSRWNCWHRELSDPWKITTFEANLVTGWPTDPGAAWGLLLKTGYLLWFFFIQPSSWKLESIAVSWMYKHTTRNT